MDRDIRKHYFPSIFSNSCLNYDKFLSVFVNALTVNAQIGEGGIKLPREQNPLDFIAWSENGQPGNVFPKLCVSVKASLYLYGFQN